MKKLLILLNVLIGILIIGACDESQVGYLLTKDAAYEPDTIIIRQTLDPELDAVRIETGAPWVSLKMQKKRTSLAKLPIIPAASRIEQKKY